jgi:hypothetical protein
MSRRALDVNRSRYQAFGLRLLTDLGLPGAWSEPRDAGADTLEITLEASIPRTLPEATLEWAAPIDGHRLTLELGSDQRRLFTHNSGRYLLSTDGRHLACAPTDSSDPAWFRVLLDSILLCVALVRGREGLHAASVIVGDGTIAVAAPSGGGKSTLVVELLNRGHVLLADDISFLETDDRSDISVLPGPPVMTLPLALANRMEPLMRVEGEVWVSASVSASRAPLRAVVYLNRRPGAALDLHTVDHVALRLLGTFLALPRTPERAVSRLDLAARLAAHYPVLELDADVSTSASSLADLVESAFPRV